MKNKACALLVLWILSLVGRIVAQYEEYENPNNGSYPLQMDTLPVAEEVEEDAEELEFWEWYLIVGAGVAVLLFGCAFSALVEVRYKEWRANNGYEDDDEEGGH
jgi:heme/copper-type cytochrome/quinol oxidase subunit 2